MKILAIDTATRFLALGIYKDGEFCEYNLELGPRLSSLLAPAIDRTLGVLGLEVKDMDYFACGLGPGSFTGIRVGLSTMKGLSWALDKPLVGVTTLDTLAMNAGPSSKVIVPVIDAKRNLIYSCFYRNTGKGIRKVSGYMLVTKEELFSKLRSPAVFLGDGLDLYRQDILKNMPGAEFLDKDQWYPKARNVIRLALGVIKKGRLGDPFKVNPVYLYPKECQIKK